MAMRGFSVVVAEAVSSNGHRYSDEALSQMAGQLMGKPVMAKEPGLDSDDGDLSNICGIVNHAEFAAGRVTASIAWLGSDPIPVGKFVTPTGQGKIEAGTIVSYSMSHLTVSETSAFDAAERIPDV